MLESWKRDNSRVWAAIQAVKLDKIGNGLPPDLMPVVYEPEHKGFRLVSLLGQFAAVPVRHVPPYDIYKLVANGYEGVVWGDDISSIVEKIDSRQHANALIAR